MYEEIELKYLSDIVPASLFPRFHRLDINTVGDIKNISVEDFLNMPSIGSGTAIKYEALRTIILNESERVIESFKINGPKLLPFHFSDNTDLLDLFKSIVEDYFTVVTIHKYRTTSAEERSKRDIDIIRKTLGLNSRSYERKKVATLYRVKTERIRQIILFQFIPTIRNLISDSKPNESYSCSVREEVVDLFQSYKSDLVGYPILSEFKLKEWLRDYGIEVKGGTANYFNLLLNVWGFEQVSIARHYNLKNNKFYAIGSVDRDNFLDICTKILAYLKKVVIPVPFDDIVIEVLEEFEDAEDDFIKLVCDIIFDVEKNEEGSYLLKFEYLSSINDYAYRLLYEKRKILSYNELLHLINKRLVKVNKSITMESLKHTLRQDEFIEPLGRTGNWALKDLSTNVESQIELILKALRIVDQPMTVSEITRYINESLGRKDVTSKSVSSVVRIYRKNIIKLTGNRYALAETRDIYADQVVQLGPPKKKKGILKLDEIANAAVQILQNTPGNSIQLIDLVKVLTQSNSSFKPQVIYKAINSNPLIFEKSELKSAKKDVKLIMSEPDSNSELTSQYKWIELRKILERELRDIFSSNVQPSYTASLEEGLDAFFKVVTIDISRDCLELSDLADRVLPTLHKFYTGASDRNDKLGYLKQIATSQEPYFKKLLFYIDRPSYEQIKVNRQGFGAVVDKLPKVDPRRNRYLEIRPATLYEFGKHCSRAYSNRNMDTHNAKSWTESEIVETKTSCLVFMVYAGFEYYNEISRL